MNKQTENLLDLLLVLAIIASAGVIALIVTIFIYLFG